jgi:hypothetical protein
MLPHRDYLIECFDLREDGRLFWRERPLHHFKDARSRNSWNAAHAGDQAGHCNPIGYFHIAIENSKYMAHRIVFLIFYGWEPASIDHIDMNKSNNDPKNLRPATFAQNNANMSANKANKSGVKGVHWHKQTNKWIAKIGVNGKHVHLGMFNNKDDAAKAYEVASIKYWGEFARQDNEAIAEIEKGARDDAK